MSSLFSAARRASVTSLALVLVLVLAACSGGSGDGNGDGNGDGGASAAPGGATATVEDGTVEVTADDLAFSVEVIEAPAGEGFTVVFTNNESVPHNWALYTEEGGDMIAQGDVIGEGETNEVEVPALEAGTYFFVCDVHPTEMTGEVVVEG
jgi:plastocyanin